MKNAYKIRLFAAIILLIGAITAIYGIYPFKFLNFQFTPAFTRSLFDFTLLSGLIIGLLFVLPLLFGRLYCSLLCPLGTIQEIAGLIFKKKNKYIKSNPIKYFVSALAFGVLIGGSTLILRYIDPYTIFGSSFTLTLSGGILILLILVLTVFKDRLFCASICPVGTILGLISKISLFKIKIDENTCVSCSMCEKNCPTSSINSKEKYVDNETCIKCLKCLNVCKLGAIKYKIHKQKPAFSLKRRQILYSLGVIGVFTAALKGGMEIAIKTGNKIKEIILPPGALNTQRMTNKCLNCNLCINNCPNKILTKADKNIAAVHIDYTKGEKYCKFDCNECSKTCPAGAIKKIDLEEKQKTRIALAVINQDKCTSCGICAEVCPKGAIKKEDKTYLDSSKCIGCNRCKISCPNGAIELFALNEQKVI